MSDLNEATWSQRPSQTSSPSHQLSSASSHADLNYLFGAQDPSMIIPKSSRNRRKGSQASDQTKHRRTRSGCYTCRSRRVKCDENRPICERCKKGGRECIYPDTLATSKPSASGSSKLTQTSTRESPDSSSDDYEEGRVPGRPLKAIPDEDGDISGMPVFSNPNYHRTDTTLSSNSRSLTRNSSETPSLVQDKGNSPTPSTEGSIGYSAFQNHAGFRRSKRLGPGTFDKFDWSHLPEDLQFYLTYHHENITHFHYSLKYDPHDFIRTQFLEVALGNEALLYAIVGFSAFQYTLHNPGGNIHDFLQYYNKSVSLLLKSLKRGEKHSHGTILAMLQLATVEEFFGDWVNLLGHQKAAKQILTELYTPQTIMETDMSRAIIGWYMRFDVFAGLMGGFETVLSRDWFTDSVDFCRRMVADEPLSLTWKIECALCQHRLIAMDMSMLFSKIGKGEISKEEFLRENAALGTRIWDWKAEMDPALQDSRFLVTDFTGAPPRQPNDIVDPYAPGVIHSGPLWSMNVARIDWHAVDLMHKYQTALIMREQPSSELTSKAYATCQLLEAMQFYPGCPAGTMLSCQASLGIACLFLPRDNQHSMWARRKLALIETNGYIYPYTFRTKMADIFRDRSCMHWWLPNDEGYPPIIRSIRKFVEERSAPAKDVATEGLRDMKTIFASLNLDDTSSTIQVPDFRNMN